MSSFDEIIQDLLDIGNEGLNGIKNHIIYSTSASCYKTRLNSYTFVAKAVIDLGYKTYDDIDYFIPVNGSLLKNKTIENELNHGIKTFEEEIRKILINNMVFFKDFLPNTFQSIKIAIEINTYLYGLGIFYLKSAKGCASGIVRWLCSLVHEEKIGNIIATRFGVSAPTPNNIYRMIYPLLESHIDISDYVVETTALLNWRKLMRREYKVSIEKPIFTPRKHQKKRKINQQSGLKPKRRTTMEL